MKVEMKNGDIVDCTVAEYMQLRSLNKEANPAKRAYRSVEVPTMNMEPSYRSVIVKTPKKERAFKAWKPREIKMLKANANLPVAKLAKMLGRTKHSIYLIAHSEGGLRKMRKKLNRKAISKTSVVHSRSAFVATKGYEYMKAGMKRKDAWSKAAGEWKNNQTQKVKTE